MGFKAEEILDRTDGVKFGLMSVRERLVHLGGSIDVQTTPGEGTKVTIKHLYTLSRTPMEKHNADTRTIGR